jgi:mannitol-1-/sugar-/sorbitol-6-phosphatase
LPMPAVLVGAGEVTRGKPSPEGYLRAAAGLGFAPGACVVVEDAPAGIEAGLAAGMRVLALRTTDPHLAAPGAEVAPDLSFVQVCQDGGAVRLRLR